MHKEQNNIFESLKDHGYTGIDQISKVGYLSEGINTMGLDSVKTHIMSDEGLRKYFGRYVTLYKDFIKQSNADDRQSLGISASSSNNASGNKNISFAPEDQYYDSNNWYALSKSNNSKVLKSCSSINGGEKSYKPGVHSKSGVGGNNGQGKWNSKIVMPKKKVNNQKRQFVVFNTAAKPGSDNKESDDSEKEEGNRKHSALIRQ